MLSGPQLALAAAPAESIEDGRVGVLELGLRNGVVLVGERHRLLVIEIGECRQNRRDLVARRPERSFRIVGRQSELIRLALEFGLQVGAALS